MVVTAVVPVKSWRQAKSRLGVSDELRMALARAFALDVLAALRNAASVRDIVLVTTEPELVNSVSGYDVSAVLKDSSALSSDPLNGAITLGRGWADQHRESAGLLAVPADLPAITGSAVEDALEQMSTFDRAFVPDAASDGTTLLFASTPGAIQPHYGPQSARWHTTCGYRSVTAVDRVVRRDVDTLADLIEARQLGVGGHTQSALARLRCADLDVPGHAVGCRVEQLT
jgi:2-phospho-L-lactate guanylyltransferase